MPMLGQYAIIASQSIPAKSNSQIHLLSIISKMKYAVAFVLTFLFVNVLTHPAQKLEDIEQIPLAEHSYGVEVDEMELLSRQKRQHGTAEVNVQRDRFGTNLGANVNANIWQTRDGRGQLTGQANYNRHFGGPGGSSRPNYGVGLNYVHRF